MKLHIVTSHKSRLDEAILIADTMYSLIEKLKDKYYKFTSIFLYYPEPQYIITAKIKYMYANMSFSLYRENLIPQILSVLHYISVQVKGECVHLRSAVCNVFILLCTIP